MNLFSFFLLEWNISCEFRLNLDERKKNVSNNNFTTRKLSSQIKKLVRNYHWHVISLSFTSSETRSIDYELHLRIKWYRINIKFTVIFRLIRRMKISNTKSTKITNLYERVQPWKQIEIIKVQWEKVQTLNKF